MAANKYDNHLRYIISQLGETVDWFTVGPMRMGDKQPDPDPDGDLMRSVLTVMVQEPDAVYELPREDYLRIINCMSQNAAGVIRHISFTPID